MSNKVHGFCDAGCKYRVPTYDEFLQSASLIKQNILSDGSALIEKGLTYKVRNRNAETDTTWGIDSISVYAKAKSNGFLGVTDFTETYLYNKGLPAADKYDKWLKIRLLDAYYQWSGNDVFWLYVVVEFNGERVTIPWDNAEYNAALLGELDVRLYVNAVTDCLLVNEDASIELVQRGEDGADGVGIKSIEKTATEGLNDIYTITLTDGKTYNFTVTNGGDCAEIEARLDAIEKQLAGSNYQNIAITSFYASKTTYEMGESVTSVTLNWNTNKTPTALTLDGTTINATNTSETLTDFVNMNSAKKSWTLTATGENGETDTKTAAISFLNGVYYGEAAEPVEYNSDFILGLAKTLRSTYISSFSADAGDGQYIYYCLPVRMGARSFKVGGFDGGFSLVATIDFTNSKGYTESYYIYRSDNAALGSTSVTVS